MIVNKELMARARFEKKKISELTVAEFRYLMQEITLQTLIRKEQIDNEKFYPNRPYSPYANVNKG